jgi:hypothetical protein
MFEHFRGDWAYAEPNFFGELWKKICSQNFLFGPVRCVPRRFSKISIIYVICIVIWYFWLIFKNYIMHMLSICGNNFIAHWAYEDTISSHTEHTRNKFSRMLSQRKNVKNFCMYIHAEHMQNKFHRTLSIRGMNFIVGWAYPEWISSLAEHTRKCLKVKYLGLIEYEFQKSPVTGPWDHKVSVSAKKVKKNFTLVYL